MCPCERRALSMRTNARLCQAIGRTPLNGHVNCNAAELAIIPSGLGT